MDTNNQLAAIMSNMAIDSLNEMQQMALVTIAKQNNTMLLSPTGSGKTLAFLLPVYQQLNPAVKTVQCLIVVPSRELALQIEQVWKKMGTGYKVNACYGGHSREVELRNLGHPPAVLVGTPGRLNDHLTRQSFDPDSISILVLDEFDKSLQLGFHDDMESIVQQLPNVSKRILLSATSDVEVPAFLRLNKPAVLDYTPTHEQDAPALSLKLVLSESRDKVDCLFKLICTFHSEPALIFCNHREASERISSILSQRGIETAYYHGGMDQDDRERVLVRFRNHSLRYLVTTDLAARGLDIPTMKHVIHYQLPSKESEYIHRNGRTARMNATGTAYVIQHQDEELPAYIAPTIEVLQIPEGQLPMEPDFRTIYINGGKKNKINKGDIVGFFLQKGGLEKDDLGLVEVKDFVSFVAVRTQKVKGLLHSIKEEKMKGKKYKIKLDEPI